MPRLTVSIVTPTKQAVKTEADMVIAPSAAGEVGILPQHRSLLADLVEGIVSLKTGDKTERYAVSGGFIEVDRDRVAVLAETAEHSSEIDLERAKAALKDAEAELKKLDPLSTEYSVQTARLKRAQVRIALAHA
jgi:F-type H+-transporting ATPase subunit epsilon